MPLRSMRTRSVSSLQPQPASSSSQPCVRVVQPSPRIQRSRGGRERVALTQPCPIPIAHEELACPICAIDVADTVKGLMCEQCSTWYHASCLFISDTEYDNLANSTENWFCDHCSSIRANKINWGPYKGESEVSAAISAAYKGIIKWKKNLSRKWFPYTGSIIITCEQVLLGI